MPLAALVGFTAMVLARPPAQAGATTPLAARLPQGGAAAVGGTDEGRGERDRELRRVLALAGGRFVRGKTRWIAAPEGSGRWEVRRRGGWAAVAAVAWARSERELLAEARERAAEIARDALPRQVELARWMAGVGLAEEGLDVLDRVLAREPDHPGALAALRSYPAPRELEPLGTARSDPGRWLRGALAVGAGAGPARRELVVRELGRVFAARALRKVLARELVAGAFRRRSFATLALRRLLPGEQVRELLRRAALDPADEVRTQAALALREIGREEPGIVWPLVRALESGNASVRRNAAQSLGRIGVPAVVGPLVAHLARIGKPASPGAVARHGLNGSLAVSSQLAYVKDFDVELAQGASIGDPVVDVATEGVWLDVRVGGISSTSAREERRTVCAALERLTGADPGCTAEAWRRWYQAHRERFESPGAETTAAEPAGSDGGR